jgi:hypothetical protein
MPSRSLDPVQAGGLGAKIPTLDAVGVDWPVFEDTSEYDKRALEALLVWFDEIQAGTTVIQIELREKGLEPLGDPGKLK